MSPGARLGLEGGPVYASAARRQRSANGTAMGGIGTRARPAGATVVGSNAA